MALWLVTWLVAVVSSPCLSPCGSLGGGNPRTGGDQLLPHRINLDVQALERGGSEEHHVAGLGEHHQFRRLRPACSHQGVADVPVNAAAVGDDEALFPFSYDPQPLKDASRNPGILGASIYQRVGQGATRPAPVEMLDLDGGTKEPHVVHGNTPFYRCGTDSLLTTSNLRSFPGLGLPPRCHVSGRTGFPTVRFAPTLLNLQPCPR